MDTGGNGNPSGLKVSNGDRSGLWSCDCWACYGQGRIEWKTQNWNFFTGFRLVRNAVSSKSLQAKILLNWYAKYRLKRAIFYSFSCFKLESWNKFICYLKIIKIIKLGQRDHSVGKGTKPDDLSLVPRIFMVQWEKQLPKVALWPPYRYPDMLIHTNINQCNKNFKLKPWHQG